MFDDNVFNISIKRSYFIEMLELGNCNEINIKPYQYLIKKLIYLFYSSRPNITFIIDHFSNHNSNFKNDHMKDVKKIMQYLKKTMYL